MKQSEDFIDMKTAIVYYSGTGNTKMMTDVLEKELAKKGEVSVFTAPEFSADMLQSYDVIAFGCPAMGTEELEQDEFEPMFASLENNLGGKRIILFGSYAWADGEWMRTWRKRCEDDGAVVLADITSFEAPDDAVNEALTEAVSKI